MSSALDLSYAFNKKIQEPTQEQIEWTQKHNSMSDDEYLYLRKLAKEKAKIEKRPFTQQDYEISIIRANGKPVDNTKYLNEDNIKVVHKETHPCRSWVRNFYNLYWYYLSLESQWVSGYQAGESTIKDITGADRNSYHVSATNGIWAAVNTSSSGIVVGSNNTAWSFEDYILGTQIATGTSNGYLYYSEQLTGITPVYDADTDTWSTSHIRFFENYSADAGTINVNELGIYYRIRIPALTTARYCCVLREVLGATVAVDYREILRAKILVGMTINE